MQVSLFGISRFATVLVLCVLTGCAGLPDTNGRATSRALSDTANTSLERAIRPLLAGSQQSAFHPLPGGPDAFDARVSLARLATRSLDVQYYIWHRDESGKRLIHELILAADRGVRVRVLLDDLGVSPSDEGLLALDSHPNVEVRLFNPVAVRSLRLLNIVFDFGRLNRRMHNKVYLADNQLAIVGGRNISDQYFDAHNEMNFGDLDVLAGGPVVRDVSQSFDEYWNSPVSIEITALTSKKESREQSAARRADIASAKAPASGKIERQLKEGRVPFLSGRARAEYDAPEKVITDVKDTSTHLAPKIRSITQQTQNKLLIVSPYFIPGERGVELLTSLRKRGVRVVLLTNSLASTDLALVHAGYRRYREPLLRAGVEIYENKASGGWGGGSSSSPFASGRGSLHAKTFVFDERTTFIGSMNLDPRSLDLNTEIGLIIESRELASDLSRSVIGQLDRNAFRVTLGDRGLVWTTIEKGRPLSVRSEPQASMWKRMRVNLFGWLPIESLL